MPKLAADDLPIRSDAKAASAGSGPEGALGAFRERGQTAEGGASMADALDAPKALGQDGAPFRVTKG